MQDSENKFKAANTLLTVIDFVADLVADFEKSHKYRKTNLAGYIPLNLWLDKYKEDVITTNISSSK
jgi:hypothetical protein